MIRLGNLLSFATGWQRYLLVGLGAVSLALSGTVYVMHLKINTVTALRTADQQAYKAAQAQAETKFLAYKTQKEKDYRDKALKTDTELDALKSQYSSTVLQLASAQRKAGLASILHPYDSGAKGPDGPSSSSAVLANAPETLVVTVDDALICSDNTARLQKAHEWALDLNK